MPNFGFGSRRERQEAEQALAAVRIHNRDDAVRRLKRGNLDPTYHPHIITAFGQCPNIQKEIAKRSQMS